MASNHIEIFFRQYMKYKDTIIIAVYPFKQVSHE